MHACGHDAHTAILLCLAEAFAENSDMLRGKIVFFYSSRVKKAEKAPKSSFGTALWMESTAFFGLHVGTKFPVGTIITGIGTRTASSDTFCIEIKGKGHARGNAPCRNRPDHDGLHDCVGTEFDPQQTDQSA